MKVNGHDHLHSSSDEGEACGPQHAFPSILLLNEGCKASGSMEMLPHCHIHTHDGIHDGGKEEVPHSQMA